MRIPSAPHMNERQKQERDKPILNAGWVRFSAQCYNSHQEPVETFLNPHPSIKTWDFSEDKKQASRKVADCEKLEGCPEDCQLRRLLRISDRDISAILRNSMGTPKLPQPSRLRRLRDRIGL